MALNDCIALHVGYRHRVIQSEFCVHTGNDEPRARFLLPSSGAFKAFTKQSRPFNATTAGWTWNLTCSLTCCPLQRGQQYKVSFSIFTVGFQDPNAPLPRVKLVR
jgi:hypothetical protein